MIAPRATLQNVLSALDKVLSGRAGLNLVSEVQQAVEAVEAALPKDLPRDAEGFELKYVELPKPQVER